MINRNFAEVSSSLPTRIEDALDEVPVCEITKQVPLKNIEAFLAIELTKLQSMVNIDNRLNLQGHQIPVIAQELLNTYSRESLADFTICFRRGAMGKYGEIFKIDISVIMGWMSGTEKQPGYLEEKYQAIENRLMRERDNHYQETTEQAKLTNDWVAEWKRLNDYQEAKKEDPNAYERERIKHRSRTYRKEYLKMLLDQGLVKWAEWHRNKPETDLVYAFKIEDHHIVAKDQEEAREIFMKFKI